MNVCFCFHLSACVMVGPSPVIESRLWRGDGGRERGAEIKHQVTKDTQVHSPGSAAQHGTDQQVTEIYQDGL